MGRAYTLDLREKVIFFISQGGGKREASKLFNIGEDTIYRWLRLAQAGTLQAKKRTEFSRKIPDAVLLSYVHDHPDHTLHEIGNAIGLSASKIWKHLKRLGITIVFSALVNRQRVNIFLLKLKIIKSPTC
jgi:putative transposase